MGKAARGDVPEFTEYAATLNASRRLMGSGELGGAELRDGFASFAAGAAAHAEYAAQRARAAYEGAVEAREQLAGRHEAETAAAGEAVEAARVAAETAESERARWAGLAPPGAEAASADNTQAAAGAAEGQG